MGLLSSSSSASVGLLPAATYAVGDIHGRLDLLGTLLGQIVQHRKEIEGTAKLIFIGDYIDRGPDSKGVVDLLRSGELNNNFDEVIALKGNHEWILWEILRNGMDAASWLYRNGGVATLKSYAEGGKREIAKLRHKYKLSIRSAADRCNLKPSLLSEVVALLDIRKITKIR